MACLLTVAAFASSLPITQELEYSCCVLAPATACVSHFLCLVIENNPLHLIAHIPKSFLR